MINNMWMFSSVLLIISIMIYNPKSQGMIGQNQILNGTRSAQDNLNKFTWIMIVIFFLLTIYLAALNKLD